MLEPPLNPMLLSRKEKPFDSKEYIFEIKWDGYRCLTFIDDNKIILQSRNKKNLLNFFPELSVINNYIKAKKAIFDGEICYLGNTGKPIFSKLQGRLNTKKVTKVNNPVNLILWDLIAYENKDIFLQPLIERKELLENLIEKNKTIIISPYIIEKGKELYARAEREQLEGIVAKKIDSPYEFKRSKYWYKIKCWQYITTYIGGYSKNGSSFAVGMFKDNQLFYMGKVNISLSREMREALFRFFPSIVSGECPFKNKPKGSEIYWVRPVIKTKIRYTELSSHNTFRHGYAVEILYDKQ